MAVDEAITKQMHLSEIVKQLPLPPSLPLGMRSKQREKIVSRLPVAHLIGIVIKFKGYSWLYVRNHLDQTAQSEILLDDDVCEKC